MLSVHQWNPPTIISPINLSFAFLPTWTLPISKQSRKPEGICFRMKHYLYFINLYFYTIYTLLPKVTDIQITDSCFGTFQQTQNDLQWCFCACHTRLTRTRWSSGLGIRLRSGRSWFLSLLCHEAFWVTLGWSLFGSVYGQNKYKGYAHHPELLGESLEPSWP